MLLGEPLEVDDPATRKRPRKLRQRPVRRTIKYRLRTKHAVINAPREMRKLPPRRNESQARREEERKAIALLAEPPEPRETEDDVAEHEDEPHTQHSRLHVEIRQQDEDELVDAREERREEQHVVHRRCIEIDAAERQQIAADGEEHEREQELELDDLPQLEPERIDEIADSFEQLKQLLG